MSPLDYILSAAVLVSLVAWVYLLRFYLPGYFTAKGKNLATKEDIAEITRRVETVRAAITQEMALLERRRDIYQRMGNAMRIFIETHGASPDQQNEFHSAYSACWLWAPDDVLGALNDFLILQREHSADPSVHPQDELKAAFARVILAMRRDAGFQETTMREEAYLFLRFG